MDWVWTYLIWCISFLMVLVQLRLYRSRRSRLPPGPPGWPVFGNMFDLGSMPHKTIAELKTEYGPVVWLRIGSINTMVILSADAATELFKKHDASFVERSITEVMKAHNFHRAAVSLAPYGSYWRVMRRIMTVEMLVLKRINETEAIRRRCVADMVEWVRNEAKSGQVHVSRFVFLAGFNMLGNLMLSQDLVSPDSEEGSEFFAAMVELAEWSGHPNVVDLFPWLKWFDPQGLRRKMESGMGRTLKIVGEFVEKRMKEKQSDGNGNGNGKGDFLEVLLRSKGNGTDETENITDHDLNILIMVIPLHSFNNTITVIQ